MKLLSLRFRHAAIISLIIITLSTVHAESDAQSRASFIENWHALENAVIDSFHSLVDTFQDIFHVAHHTAPKFNYDVTLVGFVNPGDGIGNHPILFKECLGPDIKVNFLSTRDIPPHIEDAALGLPRLNPSEIKNIGAISILTDILADQALNLYKLVPESHIKIAYTMFESTEIPRKWVAILNNKFDMAVVPDPFLVEVYKRCGVQIPIFVLPLPLKLHDFLKVKPQSAPHKPFTFGLTGGFWGRKNHIRVLEAFAAEFGNCKDVKLRLHGRFGEEVIIKELTDKIKEYNLSNVELIVKPYSREEYVDFFKTLDSYVFLSTGEGFSITPREALACGMPCILTNNTAQTSICNSGMVRVVPANVPVPAMYDCHDDATHYGFNYLRNFNYVRNFELLNKISATGDDEFLDNEYRMVQIGTQFDCTVQDAREAMRDVYKHYDQYKGRADVGREWVKRYLRENLSKQYMSLVKPASIALAQENIIGDTFLMTNSPELYAKYQYLLGK